jgi:hypothetical protein
MRSIQLGFDRTVSLLYTRPTHSISITFGRDNSTPCLGSAEQRIYETLAYDWTIELSVLLLIIDHAKKGIARLPSAEE